MSEHFEANLAAQVMFERFLDDESRRLGAIAFAPHVLFADHDPKQRRRVGNANEIGQGGAADEAIRRFLMDGVAGAAGGHWQDDGIEIAARLDFVERSLVVAKQACDFLIGIPALKRGPVFRHVTAQNDEVSGSDWRLNLTPRTALKLVALSFGFLVVHRSPPQPREAAFDIDNFTSQTGNIRAEVRTVDERVCANLKRASIALAQAGSSPRPV